MRSWVKKWILMWRINRLENDVSYARSYVRAEMLMHKKVRREEDLPAGVYPFQHVLEKKKNDHEDTKY